MIIYIITNLFIKNTYFFSNMISFHPHQLQSSKTRCLVSYIYIFNELKIQRFLSEVFYITKIIEFITFSIIWVQK